jgi:hypothetical protein
MGDTLSILVNRTGFVTLGIVIGFFLFKGCGNEQGPTVLSFTDTIPGDSIPYIVYKDRPVPYKVIQTDSYPVFDTVQVLSEHFATNYYADTLKDDTSALIAFSAFVEQNKIQGLELVFQNRRPTAINHHYAEKKNVLFVGVSGNLTGIGVEAGYGNGLNRFGLTYSNQGIGIKYSRDLYRW